MTTQEVSSKTNTSPAISNGYNPPQTAGTTALALTERESQRDNITEFPHTVGLSRADLAILRKPFQPREHEFLKGLAYITESAITTRLEDVDPAWTFEIITTQIRETQVTVISRLTVKGVSRDGVGMHPITIGTKDGKEYGEAEKSAATDSLKRASRLFGVGRYLLDLEGVTDEASLKAWLIKNYSTPTPPVQDMSSDKSRRIDTTPKQQIGVKDQTWCEWCGDVPAAPGEPCHKCVMLGASAQNKPPKKSIQSTPATQKTTGAWMVNADDTKRLKADTGLTLPDALKLLGTKTTDYTGVDGLIEAVKAFNAGGTAEATTTTTETEQSDATPVAAGNEFAAGKVKVKKNGETHQILLQSIDGKQTASVFSIEKFVSILVNPSMHSFESESSWSDWLEEISDKDTYYSLMINMHCDLMVTWEAKTSNGKEYHNAVTLREIEPVVEG